MARVQQLAEKVAQHFSDIIQSSVIACNELTLVVNRENLLQLCISLRDEKDFQFDQLIDVCGVDYLDYGIAEWVTDNATNTGFERGANREEGVRVYNWENPRFASVYHLLSVKLNHRVRIKVYLEGNDEQPPVVPSVVDIWSAANWFEREAFDMYGILYEGHPDLRTILTDYGFIGHPFRKDFPLIGQVEMRYDATEERVIYEPVSIKPRILVPKVIREDSRYQRESIGEEGSNG